MWQAFSALQEDSTILLQKQNYILCKHSDYSSTSSRVTWNSKPHLLLWHILAFLNSRWIILNDWMLYSCFYTFFISQMREKNKNKQQQTNKQLGSVLPLVVELKCCVPLHQATVQQVKCLLEVFHPPPPPGVIRFTATSQTQTKRVWKKKTLTKGLIKSASWQAFTKRTAEGSQKCYIKNIKNQFCH